MFRLVNKLLGSFPSFCVKNLNVTFFSVYQIFGSLLPVIFRCVCDFLLLNRFALKFLKLTQDSKVF